MSKQKKNWTELIKLPHISKEEADNIHKNIMYNLSKLGWNIESSDLGKIKANIIHKKNQ